MSEEASHSKNNVNDGSDNEADGGVRRNWEASFLALLDYKNIYGNTLVPSAYEQDTALGHWVRKQRRYESSGKLPPDKRQRLDAIGFVWKLRGEQLPERQPSTRRQQKEKSAQQKEKPAQQKEKPPQHVLFQKPKPKPEPMQVRSASLTSENHKAISAAALKKRNWDESFEALVVYKEEFGHTNVSRSYHDHALGQWVGKQRRQQSKLTKKQRENLKSLGFDFARVGTRSKDVWEDNFAMLAQYQEEHGDCMVDEDHELSAWVAEQRQSFLEERLPPKRAKSLESIGFQFYTDPSILDDININSKSITGKKEKTSLSERWGVQYESLVLFYEQNGHCLVSRGTHKQLSYWVTRQRQLNLQNKLKPERKELLDEINFEWYSGINELPEHYFDEMLQRLEDFKLEFGHVEVPISYRRGGLGQFVESMKLTGAEGQMLPEEAQKLLRLGFAWTENRKSWFKHYERVADEIESSRGCNELMLSGRSERWLKVQFMLLEYDLLLPKRVEKLEDLDVEWDGETLLLKENDGADNTPGDNSDSDNEIFSTGAMFKAAAMAWSPDGKTKRVDVPEQQEANRAEDTTNQTGPGTPAKDQEQSAMDISPTETNHDDSGKDCTGPEAAEKDSDTIQQPESTEGQAAADSEAERVDQTNAPAPESGAEAGPAEHDTASTEKIDTDKVEGSKSSTDETRPTQSKRQSPDTEEAENATAGDVVEGEPLPKKARVEKDDGEQHKQETPIDPSDGVANAAENAKTEPETKPAETGESVAEESQDTDKSAMDTGEPEQNKDDEVPQKEQESVDV